MRDLCTEIAIFDVRGKQTVQNAIIQQDRVDYLLMIVQKYIFTRTSFCLYSAHPYARVSQK